MTLQETFDLYNRRYFRGRLPQPIRIGWTRTGRPRRDPKRPDDYLTCAYCDADETHPINLKRIVQGEIRIHKRWEKWEHIWQGLLLHEMAHWKLRNHPVDGLYNISPTGNHGHAFQREMKRLARVGAFKHIW